MGLRRGDGHAQGLRRVFAGDEGRPLVLDRVEEVLQFPPQWFFLSHVDLLRMVLERNLVQVERVQRPERAGAHGHGLFDVVHLDEILEAGESELSDLHRGKPVDLNKAVDAVPETEQDDRVVLELLMELATVVASGFSTRRGTPAWIASRATFAWCCVGTHTLTASSSSRKRCVGSV